MNEVLNTIKERSSIRKYKADMITKEQLEAIVNAGLQGPTANNKQEVHITVVKGNDPVMQELAQDVAAMAAREGFVVHYDAPVVFILSADKDFYFGAVDAGIACENMALAAQSLGLGSVILGMPWRVFESEKKDYYGEKFGFPENYVFKIALAVGYKDTEKEAHTYEWEKNVTVVE